MLEYLSGTDSEIGRRTKAERKEHRKELISKGKVLAHKGLKVAGAPAREAFLVLVKLNFLKLATHLLKAYKQDPKAVLAFWDKAAGKPEKLKEAIAHGAKSALSGRYAEDMYHFKTKSGENVAFGVALEAAAASATPIIVAVLKLFKSLKVTKPEDEQALSDAAQAGAAALDANADDPNSTHITKVDENGRKIAKVDEHGEPLEDDGATTKKHHWYDFFTNLFKHKS